LTEQHTDELKIYHARFHQHIQSIPVYGGDMRMHIYSDGNFIFNGRTYPETEEIKTTATFPINAIIDIINKDLKNSQEIVIHAEEWNILEYGHQYSKELVW